MSNLIVRHSSIQETVDKINAECKTPAFAPTKQLFYPINRGFVVSQTILDVTHNSLSALCVLLPQVYDGKERLAEVQVKKLSMPHKGETIEGYLHRIDSILKDLDDHGKFVEF